MLARGLKRRQGRVVEAEFKEKLGGDGVMMSPENRLGFRVMTSPENRLGFRVMTSPENRLGFRV